MPQTPIIPNPAKDRAAKPVARKEKSNNKLALVLGAGSTYADGQSREMGARPPLNKGFFQECAKDRDASVREILESVEESLLKDYRLALEQNDDLEHVLVKVFSDIHIPRRRKPWQTPKALYSDLLMLLSLKLASATNTLSPSRESGLGKLVSWCLGEKACKPEDVSILTFNYDLHIEKNLQWLGRQPRFRKHGQALFNFPHLYEMEGIEAFQPSTRQGDRAAEISLASPQDARVSLLKLHGSLNWIAMFDSGSDDPVPFRPGKEIAVVPSLSIAPGAVQEEQDPESYTNPVIVPPIAGKSAVIRREISELWAVAEERLRSATEVVIYGYSCPSTDFEGIHLLEHSIAHSESCRHISVINPDASVVGRMGTIPHTKPVTLFPSVDAFLDFMAG